jgi:hypothetical protein
VLTGCNDTALRYKNVDDSIIFLYQRWQELLDSRTLDMYQYNILNSCEACNELLDVINKTLNGLLTSRQNVDDVKAEALEIIKNDDVIKKHDLALQNALLRIVSSKIESKQNNANVEDKSGSYFTSLYRLKFQLESPVRMLNDRYMHYVLVEIKDNIAARDNEATERHLSLLVSQCISKGWSARGLLLLVSFFEGNGSFDEKWDKFCNSINPDSRRKFNIFYSVQFETRRGLSAQNVRDVIVSLGLVIQQGREIISEGIIGHEELYSKLSSDKYYIIVETLSTDYDAAALTAINNLNRNLSVATFYNTVNPWIANSPQIVVFSCEDKRAKSFKITEVFRTYDYVDSTNNVFEDTKNILVNTQKHNVMNRLHAAFSYTNLSRSSMFQETKYIALWIAVESVMRTGQYSDIISHIKLVLPEVLAIRYVYRIIRNFSEDCIRCGFRSDHNLDLNMESLEKKALVTKLISIFRDTSHYQVLELRCRCNALLIYRCKQIHDILTNTQTILDKLDHYVNKVRWHIQRLYRIRNEITHSAFQDDKSLSIYIEHLYTYLSQLISEVVFYIEHKGVNSIEDAYSFITENYKTYMELLREGHFRNIEVLPNGIINVFDYRIET